MNTPKRPSLIPTIIVFLVSWVICLVLIGGTVCSDGWGSRSIGRSGACSHHGGVRVWPNVLALFGSIFLAFKFHEFRTKNAVSSSQNISRTPITESVPQPISISLAPSPKIRKRNDKNNKSCPRCRSRMVLRTAKTGRNAGSQFFGCSRYPRCKGTRSIENN